MAVSRSNPPGGMGSVNTQTNNTSGSSITTGSSTTVGSSNTVQNSNETSSRVANYLDPTARAALNSLINGLTGKGSGNNAIASGAKERDRIRMEEILANQGIRADYSKGNAFADAQGAMNATLAQAIQKSMPTITAGIDAAGTSGSALSALLTQQMAEDAAAQAAQLGLQTAINYGQIQTGQSNVIEGLLGQGSEASNLLLQALGIAKGAYENTKTSNTSSSSSKTNSSQTTNSTQATTSNQNSTSTSITEPTSPTAKKKTYTETGYGLLGSPTVTAMPGSAATRSSGQSYSQF